METYNEWKEKYPENYELAKKAKNKAIKTIIPELRKKLGLNWWITNSEDEFFKLVLQNAEGQKETIRKRVYSNLRRGRIGPDRKNWWEIISEDDWWDVYLFPIIASKYKEKRKRQQLVRHLRKE